MAAEGLAPPALGHAGRVGGLHISPHPALGCLQRGDKWRVTLSAAASTLRIAWGGGGAPTADVRVPEMSTLEGNISR